MGSWACRADLRGSTGRTVAAAVLAFAVAGVLFGAPASFASAAGAPPTPVIVDTDTFSSVDDVGALAIAFALQQKGEARVLAVGVSKRADQTSVAADSWRCVGAVEQFYNSGNVPIGTAMPNDGTQTANVDFVGPCAAKATAAVPTPDSAVNVYRRALAGAADGSVVMATTGYLGNLDALLQSPADAISPLDGHDLIAAKVKLLVVMGGGYPSRPAEHNLAGDATAAQHVASGWPTKLVWSGYEVGDNVHTGQTIPSTHPDSSPVRAAYAAFGITPGNWYYSYDLTSVYHALRPNDPQLTESASGQNTVDTNGGNSFTVGSGNQNYLLLGDADALGSTLNSLLETQPDATDTTPPAISAVTADPVSASGATISWTTDEPADTQVEYGTTTSYGSSTTLNTTKATNHSQPLTGLTAGTLYHYRVKSKDAAGNLATSADGTFTTTAATGGPTVSATPSSVGAGGTTTVSWQGVVSPRASDWIGLYKSGAGGTAITKWFYTATCTRTTGTAKASGSCSLAMPATAGTYELRLFTNGGYTRLATSDAITVGSTSAGATLSAPATATGGTSVTVSWQGVTSPKVKDWIGLFKVGAANTAAVRWLYTSSCSQTAGSIAKASGSCSVALPTTAGDYEFRLFANDTYTKLATSGTIAVGAAVPLSVKVSSTAVGKGAPVTVTWAGVTAPKVKDWLGLYKQGAATTSGALRWVYTSSCTQTAGTTAKASGSCSLIMPSSPGTFEIRLYANDGYTVLATSPAITVS